MPVIFFKKHKDTYFIEEMEINLKKGDSINTLISLWDFASPDIVCPTVNMELPLPISTTNNIVSALSW